MAARYSGVQVQVWGRIQLACIAILMEMLHKARHAMSGLAPRKWTQHLITWQSATDCRRMRSQPFWRRWGLPWRSREDMSSTSSRPTSCATSCNRVRTLQRLCAGSIPGRDRIIMLVRLQGRLSQSRPLSLRRAQWRVSEDIEEVVPNFGHLQALGWFVLQRSKVMHFIQEEDEGKLIPWCRTASFSARVSEQGVNPLTATFAHCTACARRLPLDSLIE